MTNLLLAYQKYLWAKSEGLYKGIVSKYKSLEHHMIDAGAVAIQLLTGGLFDNILVLFDITTDELKNHVINTIGALVALHDIGKCNPAFQGLTDSWLYYTELRESGYIGRGDTKYHHEHGSAYILRRNLNHDLAAPIRDMLCGTVRLHHYRNKGSISCIKHINYKSDQWIELQDSLYTTICEVFDADMQIFNRLPKNKINVFGTLLLGLIVCADWFASGIRWFEDIVCYPTNISLNDYKLKSLSVARRGLKSADLTAEAIIEVHSFFELFPEFIEKGYDLRPLQKACVELVAKWKNSKKAPLLTIIEELMGEGKTEAAIFLAVCLMKHYKKVGFYVALPTAATSNQMVNRVNNVLGGHKSKRAKLLHGMAWLKEQLDKLQLAAQGITDGDAENKGKSLNFWLRSSRRALLAQYAVGTVDQIMLAVMKKTFGVLRLLGIANKVLIIDEMHAYDYYMREIINNLLTWCREIEIPVIILSATLSTPQKNDLLQNYTDSKSSNLVKSNAYPLITTVVNGVIEKYAVASPKQQKIVNIRLHRMHTGVIDMAKSAIAHAQNGGCICVIVNTVKDALLIYDYIARNTVDMDIQVFHSRVIAKTRQRVERECLNKYSKDGNRPKKSILVATQVVEQSLDVDFDYIITYIAPIDLLLQRLGREHRHMSNWRPGVFQIPCLEIWYPVESMAGVPTGLIYSPLMLEKTLVLLQEICATTASISIPNDIRYLIDSVYTMSDTEWERESAQEISKYQSAIAQAHQAVLFFRDTDEFWGSEEDAVDNTFSLDTDDDIYGCGLGTRISQPTFQLSLLPEEIFNQGVENVDPVEIMSYYIALSLPKGFDLRNAEGKQGYKHWVKGEGACAGIYILPTRNNKYVLTDGEKDCTITIEPHAVTVE